MRRMTTKLAAVAATTAFGLSVLGSSTGMLTQTPAFAAPAKKASTSLTGDWKVDPMHTNVNFTIQHMGLSLVSGRFNDVSGTIKANAAHPEKSSVWFTIKTASVDTNVEMRDKHLRTKDFFDVAKYPNITFKSSRVKKVSRSKFVATGYLSMHGVTKSISLPFQVSGPINEMGGTRFGLVTSTTLKRSDFKIGSDQKLSNGSMALGNDVNVSISLEAVPANAPAPK